MQYLLISFLFFMPLIANAEAINCKMAKTAQDKMICSNPKLIEADTKLGNTYKEIIRNFKKQVTDFHQTPVFKEWRPFVGCKLELEPLFGDHWETLMKYPDQTAMILERCIRQADNELQK